jgi:hypothetical protein
MGDDMRRQGKDMQVHLSTQVAYHVHMVSYVLHVLNTEYLYTPSDRQRYGGGKRSVPICTQTISMSAPMNWGVTFLLRLSDSSSTIFPTANHRAALRRYTGDASACRQVVHVSPDKTWLLTSRTSSSPSAAMGGGGGDDDYAVLSDLAGRSRFTATSMARCAVSSDSRAASCRV